MSLLRKRPPKSHGPNAILRSVAARVFTTQNLNPNSFPDHPTCSYYDDQINRAARSGDFESVRRLLNKRVADGCFNTSNTFKFLNNTDSYASLLDHLRCTLPRLDGGFPRRSAYDTLVARLCKLERVEDALSVVGEDMATRENAWGPTISTFYHILSALTRKKKMEAAWRVVDLMRSHALSPDVTSYNYFLTSYCVVGDVGEASKVMRKMEDEGVLPDSRTYDALVLGACRSGKVEGAMVVMRRMQDDGVPILYSTHAHIITGLVRKGYYAQAVKFVMAYGGRDEKLDAESFGNLGSKLIKLNRPEATLITREMNKMGLKMSDQLRDFYDFHLRNADQGVPL